MIRKLYLLVIILGFWLSSLAQKNVVPATQSKLAGINLPAGTKQDKRLLSEVGAQTLLESESKQAGTTIPTAEVFEIPPVSISQFSADSLKARLIRAGWNVFPLPGDPNYQWLEKGSQYLLTYFKSSSKLTDLYIGVAATVPTFDRSTQIATYSSKSTALLLPPTQPDRKNETSQSTAVTSAGVVKSGKDETSNAGNMSLPIQSSTQNAQPASLGAYTYTTTNFDDGWTSTVQDEWVLVTKGSIRVYLWYVLPYDVSKFSGTGLEDRDYYWDNYVTRYFNVQSKQYQDGGEVISSFKPDYVEGWGVDRKTGERRFLGMTLSVAPNVAYITLASTPDETTLRQQFPKANDQYASDLTAMKRFNQFAVAKADIIGTWSESSTAAANYYYSATGNYAGMSVAAVSGKFVFNPDGTYTSEHKGATGMVGNLSTFQQEYKGKYQVSNWELIMDNRFEGKTDTNFAYFEVVRGGRVLHLNNKQYTGQWYHLIKESRQ